MNVGLALESDSLERQLSTVKPSEDALRTPPTEDWLRDEELLLESSAEGVAQDLQDSHVFKAAMDSHDDVASMLREECAHSMRKAQAVITKALL